MENRQIQGTFSDKANWWCVDFAQEILEPATIKKIEGFLSRLSTEVIFGRHRVFLKMGDRGTKLPFPLFQIKLTTFAKKYRLHSENWSFGRAASLTEAWVQAQWRTIAPELLPAEAVFDYLNPLGLEQKPAKDRRAFRSLQSLGLQSLQDVLEMPEDVLLSRCKIWIDDIKQEYFPETLDSREESLERMTMASFASQVQGRSFQLEDWIPESYLSEDEDDLRGYLKVS